VNPSVVILIILGPYLPTWRIIEFRFDLVAVFTLGICDEPSRYLYIVCMQRYKLVQPI